MGTLHTCIFNTLTAFGTNDPLYILLLARGVLYHQLKALCKFRIKGMFRVSDNGLSFPVHSSVI